MLVRMARRLRRRLLRRAARAARRFRDRLARLRRATVRVVDQETVAVSRVGGIGWRARPLNSDGPAYLILPTRLTIVLPDAAWLVRLAGAGVLTGKINELKLRLGTSPEWLAVGLQPFQVIRTTRKVLWRRHRGGLEVEFHWSKPYDVHRALASATSAVLRTRLWDQTSGPVYALDKTAWSDGTSSWPQGHLVAERPASKADPLGRPLGPYQVPAQPAGGSGGKPPPIVTAVANPYGRRLVGTATRYQLVVGADSTRSELRDETGRVAMSLDPRSAEAAVLSSRIEKYSVVAIDSPIRNGTFLGHAVRTLAGCGVVFSAADASVRSALVELGVVVVADPKEVHDLRGYALSVEAARRMAVTGDAALRRTPLSGGSLPLPTVSVLLSSMRAEHVEGCLSYLAQQTYPAMEVVVGLHGYDVSEQTHERWHDMLDGRVRVVSVSSDLTLGMVLGRLTRIADGELVTKVDDDDHYGPGHVTDLLIAWHTTGADVTAKGSRFVHFPDLDQTIDRAWAAPEVFNVTPAGGSLLLSRSTLQRIGGWSHSSRHVDTDLLTRVKSAGGLVYRTHGLEYVYVRRATGHTWTTETEQLIAQAEQTYPGLPVDVLRPEYPLTPQV
ncbi:MAG: glycosyltransferase [Micromonosporaceae bacterium]|nr:glycosyltransferase [Micromonosporaceae bacterium]